MVNRKPLQLTVVSATAATEDYEKTLLEGIQDDGTLSREGIDRVMAAISARMQPKIWNADVKKTRETYVQRADEAWDTWERTPAPSRPDLGHMWMWMMLSDRYHPATAGSGGSAGPAATVGATADWPERPW